MHKSITILHNEHRSISAVVHGLKELARLAQDAKVKPDFRVFRAMLRYIDEYPERLHHPKEDRYLFAKLLERAPQTRPLVGRLTSEHEAGARLVRELERSVVFFEEGWPAGAREFQQTVEEYARFHWDHMRIEEKELIPLAEQHLTAEDWKWVDDAFAGNIDPIADLGEKDFEKLFSRIVSLAPAPVGLGEPWKKASA